MQRAGSVPVRSAVAVILALVFAVGGPSGGWGIVPPPARTWAAPVQQAAPGPLVQQAFDLLMDRFVTPPSPGTLLTGGWEGGVRFVQERANAAPEGAAPAFTGDRAADWKAFLAAYPALVAALGAAAEQVDLDRAIVSGMARSLPDWGAFLHRPEAQPIGATQSYGGVGMQMSQTLAITEVFDGGPAQAAGLRTGDRVTDVDGMSVEGRNAQDIGTLLRGQAGSTVRLTVSRDGNLVEFTLTRAQLTLDWVSARVLDNGIGYLRVRQYPNGATDILDAALTSLVDSPALIVDLRGGTGGFWAAAQAVAGRLMPEGPLSEQVNRQGQVNVLRTTGGFWGRTIPMVVLSSQQTTGEGEALASVLRDRGGATIVGTKTPGWVGGGSAVPLADGSTLIVRTSLTRSSKGVMITGAGVEPDIVVELDPAMLAQGRDSQLEAALAHLRGKLGQ